MLAAAFASGHCPDSGTHRDSSSSSQPSVSSLIHVFDDTVAHALAPPDVTYGLPGWPTGYTTLVRLLSDSIRSFSSIGV
ncbi:hypothetical protein C8039_12570 [Halogeometricum sp. wsp3]|nr:hypothetical protein C8039_12570 [Halogeometricum sp. wsp3]